MSNNQFYIFLFFCLLGFLCGQAVHISSTLSAIKRLLEKQKERR